MSETTLTPETSAAAVAGDRAEPAAESGGKSDDHQEDSRIFDSSQFRIGPSTEAKLDNKSRVGGRTRITNEVGSGEVNLSGEIGDIFDNHTFGRVNNLIDLAKRPAPPAAIGGPVYESYLDYVLASQLASGGERELLEQCTDITRDETNRPVYKLNKEKVDKFLSTVEGQNFVAADMEHLASLTEMGLNMQAIMYPDLERRGLYQQMDAMFGDGGRISDAWHWATNQVPENIRIFFNATRFRSEALTPAQRQESIAVMQGMPQADRDYMFALLQINVNAFDGGTTNVAAGSELPEALDSDTALKNAKLALDGKRLFYKKLGIDLDKTYTPEQVILGNRDRLAMAPTLQNQRLLAEYDAAYANFIAGGALPNDAQRRQMINEVRLNIKCDIIRTYINNARAEEVSKTEKVDLTKKIIARTGAEKTAMIDRRKRMNAADREIAERSQVDLVRSQTEFANPLQQAAQALESQENQAIETHRLPIVGDLEATLEDRINNTLPTERDGRIVALEAQLVARVNQIRTDNDFNRIEQDIRFATGFKRRALRDAQALATTATTDYIDAVRNAGASIPQGAGRAVNLTFPPSPAGELAASGNTIAAAYDGELTQLEAQRTRIEGLVQVETARVEALITAERTRVDTELEALRTEQAAHRTAEAALTNAAQAVARREPQELVTGAARLGEMQGFVNAAGARVVTDAEIRTLPIADLMERITGATLPAGVAAPNDNERLLIASFAKSELSGQEYEAGNQPGANELQALNDISAIILNIGPPLVVLGEQAVLMRGNENLANLINAAGLAWTPDQITQNIVAARHLVARRLNSRYTERVRNEQAYWNGRLVPDERASETIGREIDRERAQLEAADAITANREELYVRAYDVLQPQNQELRDRLFNANIIAQNDTNYSAEERNKDLHAGYVGWLREIYPGYDGNSNEAELFNALNTIISEQELADILNEQLGLALPPNVNQINNTLRAIDMAFGAGTLNRINFEQAFIAIVNLVRQKARKV